LIVQRLPECANLWILLALSLLKLRHDEVK
jgi:hypothetical protein